MVGKPVLDISIVLIPVASGPLSLIRGAVSGYGRCRVTSVKVSLDVLGAMANKKWVWNVTQLLPSGESFGMVKRLSLLGMEVRSWLGPIT